jgi:NADPH-dependent FMN reductase
VVGIENAYGGQAMDHRDFRILGLAASLRQASFHRGIVRAAHEVAPEWMSCEGFDLARIPYFNQDIEDQGIPEPVKELREKIRTYDAVLIATPAQWLKSSVERLSEKPRKRLRRGPTDLLESSLRPFSPSS